MEARGTFHPHHIFYRKLLTEHTQEVLRILLLKYKINVLCSTVTRVTVLITTHLGSSFIMQNVKRPIQCGHFHII